MGMKEQLSEFDLCVEQNVNSEEPIDFTIKDGTGETCCDVWGSNPFNDVQVECTHPYECVDFSNDENECGECQICGAQCDWHWVYDVVDEGHDMDGKYYAKEGEVREITDWYFPKKIGGIVGDYLKDLQKRW